MDGESTIREDALPVEGQPSPNEESSPSDERTYTEAEVRERHSKLDRTISQLTREKDTYKQDLETTNGRLDELQRRIDEADEEKIRDNPELADLLRQKKALQSDKAKIQADRRELERQRLEHEADIKLAKESLSERMTDRIAGEHKIDAVKLRESCTKFGLTTEEQVADMAKMLSSGKTTQTTSLKTDSNMGSGSPTNIKSLKERYPTMYK